MCACRCWILVLLKVACKSLKPFARIMGDHEGSHDGSSSYAEDDLKGKSRSTLWRRKKRRLSILKRRQISVSYDRNTFLILLNCGDNGDHEVTTFLLKLSHRLFVWTWLVIQFWKKEKGLSVFLLKDNGIYLTSKKSGREKVIREDIKELNIISITQEKKVSNCHKVDFVSNNRKVSYVKL